jgi:hypothetical protein
MLDAFLGGWQLNGVWRFDTGQPIQLGVDSPPLTLPTYGGHRPNLLAPLEPREGSRDEIINQYFANPEAAVKPDGDTVSSGPRTLSTVRAPGTKNASLSIFKQISLNRMREGARLEFRAEAFNALNRAQFCAPSNAVGHTNFGKIFSQCNVPRDAQLALKLYW